MSVLGMVAYYLGFSVMLLGTTLFLTNGLHWSVLQAAIGLTPGPISAGLASPFSGRITARIGARRTLLAGAALFGLAAIWPLLLSFVLQSPTYPGSVLPSLILWGVANACIQPTLFGGANGTSRDDLAVATGVLSAARQLGSALGVALLVGVIASVAGDASAGIQYAWGIVFFSAALTGITGLHAGAPHAGASEVLPEGTGPPGRDGSRFRSGGVRVEA